MQTIGIIGGMGPEATAEVFMKLVKKVPAKKDSDHPKVILFSDSQIPDRTKAILGVGVSPVESMPIPAHSAS